jgi:hypothetical protein
MLRCYVFWPFLSFLRCASSMINHGMPPPPPPPPPPSPPPASITNTHSISTLSLMPAVFKLPSLPASETIVMSASPPPTNSSSGPAHALLSDDVLLRIFSFFSDPHQLATCGAACRHCFPSPPFFPTPNYQTSFAQPSSPPGNGARLLHPMSSGRTPHNI